MDAPTVTAFLAACGKDRSQCSDEVAGLINDAYIPDRSGDVCLNEDQLDEPGTLYIPVLRYLTGRREMARMKPAEAIIQAAIVLYPCVDAAPLTDAPDSGGP
jgi:hypothetical protein